MMAVALDVLRIILDITLLVSLVKFVRVSRKIYDGIDRVHARETTAVTHQAIRLLLHDKDGREVRDVTIHADEAPETYRDGGRVYQFHDVIDANRVYREV